MKNVLKAKITEEKIFKLIGHRDGKLVYDFNLSKKKLLIGRAPHADIFIDDPAISFYHAFVFIDEYGGKIVDLDSSNGIYLNGKKVERTFFSEGDTLRLGPIELHIEESIIETIGKEPLFEDQDDGVEKMSSDEILDLPAELPPLPGLVVIDGEYCDIVFDKSTEAPFNHIPALEEELPVQDYIDPEDEKSPDQIRPIARKVNQQAVEVSVLVNGNIVSLDYLPLKRKTYYASSLGRFKETLCIPSLDSEDRVPFIKIRGNEITLHTLDNLKARNMYSGEKNLFSQSKTMKLEGMDVISYECKGVQVIIRLSDSPPILRYTPFFGRDREFQKHTAKVVGIIMGIMLMLLFIDTTVEIPKKKIAIIYRKAIKTKKPSDVKSKAVADLKDKDKGIKKNKQPKKEIKMAKMASNDKKKPAKTKIKTKKVSLKKPKASSKSVKTAKKAPKMNSYKFNSKANLSSLFSASKSLKPTKINKLSQATGTQGFKSNSAASDAKVVAKGGTGRVGTLGQDFSGNYDRSSGAQGLSSKSGIDTTYGDPKTVVLGSMDPELLRKILKEYLPQFRHCYQKELENNEAAKGVISLHFRINANGTVSNINIRGKKARFSRSGVRCMAGVLRLIDFPNPKGGGVVDVKQPLNFLSSKGSY